MTPPAVASTSYNSPVPDGPDFVLSTPCSLGEPSLGAYLVQQLGVTLAGFLAVLLTANVKGLFYRFTSSEIALNALAIGWCALITLTTGATLGLVAGRFFPGAVSTGKWTWILPTALCLLAPLSEGVDGLRMLLFPGPKDAAWYAFLFLTCPTLTAAAYSASALRASRRGAEKASSIPPIQARRATDE